MAEDLLVVDGNEESLDFIEEKLTEYNLAHKALTQKEEFVRFAKVAKDQNEKVIGGVIAYSSMYQIGYIDTLWVDDAYRYKGIGRKLLTEVEQELADFGCENCHLDTYDFQAPGFYRKMGYQEFGQLRHEKANVTEYFFSKKLIGEDQ
ncbi:hypothetical protein BAU15_02285 [Enterococcus sp. JM4C]|uniref:GNAT family N-acetyltransferase n=1 Tax=Candidatus Enterococcus huntleyi TaxID=1857217 RepID=UPI00137B8BB6|nr:GNAT family N-acetyltransferase [Enterococcus sp. JM4C]KAF1299491.1 hypothetical protein BAU15_02285 [Enterococcus sp. JM4C]